MSGTNDSERDITLTLEPVLEIAIPNDGIFSAEFFLAFLLFEVNLVRGFGSKDWRTLANNSVVVFWGPTTSSRCFAQDTRMSEGISIEFAVRTLRWVGSKSALGTTGG